MSWLMIQPTIQLHFFRFGLKDSHHHSIWDDSVTTYEALYDKA